jgi:glycogen(starch) synthase
MGGAQYSALRLLKGLRERGHEFIVITRQDDPGLADQASYQGFPIYRFPFYAALQSRDISQLIGIRKSISELKRQYSPDLVHINCFGMSILFHLDTMKAHPTPMIFTLRSEKYDPVADPNTLLERTLRAADWVTAPSASTIEFTRQLAPNVNFNGSHIYNGMETPATPPEPLPVKVPHLLCMGRLVPNKGFDLALQALAKLSARFPQLRMTIAGDGSSRRDLEALTSELDLDNAVDFVGWVGPDEVAGLINTATIVVVPSRGWEALPLVALEAAFMERPVVAAKDAGLPEVVVHRETGLLVDKEDSAGLAEALASLIEHPEVAIRMGQAAKRRASKIFNMKQCIDSYDHLYHRLLKQAAITAQ